MFPHEAAWPCLRAVTKTSQHASPFTAVTRKLSAPDRSLSELTLSVVSSAQVALHEVLGSKEIIYVRLSKGKRCRAGFVDGILI